jgi:hypothetical protein
VAVAFKLAKGISMFSAEGSSGGNLAAHIEENSRIVEQIAHYYRLRPRGHQRWRGKCPIHAGRSGTSFEIRVSARTGKILLYCFAHCTFNDLWDQIRSDTGLLSELRAGLAGERTQIEKFANEFERAHFPGQAGASQRAVGRALIEIARRTGRLDIGASVRELAELAKIQSTTTVSHALWKLAGVWFQCLKTRQESEACTEPAHWRLLVDASRLDSHQLERDHVTHDESKHTEIFRRGRGLGLVAGAVFSAIIERAPIRTGELMRLLQMRWPTSLYRQLRTLARYRLIEKDDERRWILGSRRPAEIEEVLGLTDATERQLEKHREERIFWRRRNAIRRRGVG